MKKVVYLGQVFNVEWEDEKGTNLLLVNESESHSSVAEEDTHTLPDDDGLIRSIELVAFVEGWSMLPESNMPRNGRLYYYDEGKGWFYLTSAGYELYASYKVVIDEIISLVHQPAIEQWAKSAVQAVLA